MKKGKPFFFRLGTAQLLTALIQIPEAERGAWITQVAVDLSTGDPTTVFAKDLFQEAKDYQIAASERSRLAGLASAHKRQQASTGVQHPLTPVEPELNDGQPSSSKQLTETKEQKTKDLKPLSEYSDEFETFWKEYPKKKKKDEAYKAWKKIKKPVEMLSSILNALKWQKETTDWIKENGQFIPYPASYLNGGGWKDEPELCLITKGSEKTPERLAFEKARDVDYNGNPLATGNKPYF